MSSDTERAIEEILNDFERQPLQDKRTFRAYLNQPELISLSSTNAQQQSPPISPLTFAQYYNFTVNLPRPSLDAKSLQLLKAVIPQANASIPDYSLVFPYYMLRTVPKSATPGDVYFVDGPSYDNLFFVRLLPSFYKKEQLKSVANKTVDNWGYNQTFNDYRELNIQITKACLNDITFNSPFISHYYAANVEINYTESENKFIFQGQNINTPLQLNDYPEWNPDTTYSVGDTVFYDLNFYRALTTTTGVIPTFDMKIPWRRIYKFNNYTTWSSTQPYNVGNVVQYIGIFYRCMVYNQGAEPPTINTTDWLNVSQYFATNSYFNSYLVAGYEDPNVDTLLQYIQQVSQRSDNEGTSILGQLYVPQQTLSRRMGFTWDSTGIVNDVNTINTLLAETGIPFGSTVALFFNRLRPVIPYSVAALEGIEEIELGAFYDNDRLYYTADGYCNLVYSSIISIYTTIVGTSTVDTQRNANLLTMIPMDCGNLGVAMVGNYIDNALTKIQGDIYSIYIELRDENGQPYYLTNNATTTLLIKLTY